ncbi:MAG: hypothetical protein ACM32E_24535 [Gemmatimonadota bacterium]
MAPEISPLRYHRVTSYTGDTFLADQPHPDPLLVPGFVGRRAVRPPEVKTWDAGQTVDLPATLPQSAFPARQVLAGAPDAGGGEAARLDAATLAALLFFANGVVRYADYPWGRMHFRAAGSAGNLHPLEVYAVTREVAGLADGVWHHDPLGHRLRRAGDAPPAGPSYLVVTGVPGRTGWKYAERGYRHVWWDAGTLTAQLLAVAEAHRVPARVRLLFPDAGIAAGVGAAWPHEFPLVLITLGAGEPDVPPPAAATGRVAPDPLEFPLVTATQAGTVPAAPGWREAAAAPGTGTVPGTGTAARPGMAAGSGAAAGPDVAAGPGMAAGPGVAAQAPAAVPAEPIEQVILRRGSTRRFDPAAVLPADALIWAMTVATRELPWDAGPSLLEHRLLVHAIEGIPPGLYRWDGASGRPEPVTASGLPDAVLAAGAGQAGTGPGRAGQAGAGQAGAGQAGMGSPEAGPGGAGPAEPAAGPQAGLAALREESARLCMYQELGRDAAYVAVHCAEVDAIVARLGPRGYRAAQFEAGVVEGRLHLALFTLGYGATGLTFIDELVPAITGGPPAMLVTAAGQPAYQAVPGGPPRRPALIRG